MYVVGKINKEEELKLNLIDQIKIRSIITLENIYFTSKFEISFYNMILLCQDLQGSCWEPFKGFTKHFGQGMDVFLELLREIMLSSLSN